MAEIHPTIRHCATKSWPRDTPYTAVYCMHTRTTKVVLEHQLRRARVSTSALREPRGEGRDARRQATRRGGGGAHPTRLPFTRALRAVAIHTAQEVPIHRSAQGAVPIHTADLIHTAAQRSAPSTRARSSGKPLACNQSCARSAPKTRASSAMRTYMPFSI